MPPKSAPDKDSLTSDTVERCVEVYKKALRAVYSNKLKKEKLDSAVNDDDWRYNQLPSQIRDRSEREGLSKNELSRLVQWKITHGVYRPFLPGMIQKNTPEEVRDHTKLVLEILGHSNTPAQETVKSALDKVCKLKGVGPATGTLVLSVFNPERVPFFEDELFHWLFPKHAGKLKYDVKEYMQIFDDVRKVMSRTGVLAWQLEQAAFVLEHFDALDEETRAWVLGKADKTAKAELSTAPEEDRQSKSKNISKGTGDEEAKAASRPKQQGRRQVRKAQGEGANDTRPAKRAKK